MLTSRRHYWLVLCVAGILAVAGCGEEDKANYVAPTGIGPGPVDPDAPTEFTTTPSGLKYRIRRRSDGLKPGKLDGVAMHYRGWLADGQEFENSWAGGAPIVRKMTDLIPGWKEGMQLIGMGGMIEMQIPPELAFGHHGQPQVQIPPDATLFVLVELLNVLPYRTEPEPPDADAPKEMTTSGTGLQYRILRKGSEKKPKPDSVVLVRVKSTLLDGTEIDNMYRTGFPHEMLLSGGLPGFVEGLQLIGEGGMIEMLIPPTLAFGSQKKPKIPANSTLRFVVELDAVR